MATADPGVGSFTPINIWAMLRVLINNNLPFLTNAGAPTSGAAGTYFGQAGPGALLIDFTNAILYINTGTLASPTWTKTSLNAITGDVTVAAGVSVIDPSIIKIARGTITAAQIVATGAGNLGHAAGVVMVPAAPAKAINELISCVAAMDFLTAAYTGGGNNTVNIGGGAALTGLVNTTTFIQAASDIIVEFVPLAATFNNYGVGANSLNLVSSIAPTNPGTAAGVINWMCAYRTVSAIID
jgi:hypothetical protein